MLIGLLPLVSNGEGLMNKTDRVTKPKRNRKRGNWFTRRKGYFGPRGRTVPTRLFPALFWLDKVLDMVMILPQVHLRKPCYDFTFL